MKNIETSKKAYNVKKVNLCNSLNSNQQREIIAYGNVAKGIFLTRDLVSEPANYLYPEKFVDECLVLKKAGLSLEIFDEKR